MKKQIKISCIGSANLSYTDLVPFQGDLKELSEKAYKQCKNSILKHGFSEPIATWETDEGIVYVLNGHQRLKTITRMATEGYVIPKLPVTFVDCKNIKEAKEKVLALTSAFGEMSQTSLIDFCQDAEIDFDEILENYRFADINLEIDNNDPETDMEKKNDGNGSTKKTTIKIKVPKEDKDEVIEKIKETLEHFDVEIK